MVQINEINKKILSENESDKSNNIFTFSNISAKQNINLEIKMFSPSIEAFHNKSLTFWLTPAFIPLKAILSPYQLRKMTFPSTKNEKFP